MIERGITLVSEKMAESMQVQKDVKELENTLDLQVMLVHRDFLRKERRM